MSAKRKEVTFKGVENIEVSEKRKSNHVLGRTTGDVIDQTKKETVEVLLYNANTLWNDYQENPQSLTPDQREFLGSKLDTLNVNETEKQLFGRFRAEYAA